jgi:hypothetical protein
MKNKMTVISEMLESIPEVKQLCKDVLICDKDLQKYKEKVIKSKINEETLTENEQKEINRIFNEIQRKIIEFSSLSQLICELKYASQDLIDDFIDICLEKDPSLIKVLKNHIKQYASFIVKVKWKHLDGGNGFFD